MLRSRRLRSRRMLSYHRLQFRRLALARQCDEAAMQEGVKNAGCDNCNSFRRSGPAGDVTAAEDKGQITELFSDIPHDRSHLRRRCLGAHRLNKHWLLQAWNHHSFVLRPTVRGSHTIWHRCGRGFRNGSHENLLIQEPEHRTKMLQILRYARLEPL